MSGSRAWALAALVVAGALAPTATAADATRELAQRYSPVVRLVEQSEPCGHGEPYDPTDVNVVLGNPDVALRGPWDLTNIVKIAPTARDLSAGLFDYHLDFPGNAVAPGCDYERWSQRITTGSRPRVYAHVAAEPAFPDQIALQYWLFYVFNDFNDKHEGDWEMIQLDFDAPNAAAALKVKPSLVGYSQHAGAEEARWGDDKLHVVDGTHPVVYPAAGSHANYFGSALYLGRSAAQGVGCDDTSSPSRELHPAVSVIPSDSSSYLTAFPWLGYEGHWGEEHSGFYNGPTGPNTKPQWTEPITWSEEEWRDSSFTVPAGSTVGSTATDFFCGGVAYGSELLTAMVGDPSPVLIALAVLLAITLWLASRTRWDVSSPFRVPRRRPWGSIVTSASRMYTAHLGLFVGIGLVFIPLGIAITALQYLVFRLGGLAPLVDAAGPTNALVATLAFAFGLLLTVVGLSVVQTATAFAVRELDEERTITAVGAFRMALPKLPVVLGAVLLAALVIAIVNLTAIGVVIAIWLTIRWSLLAQVVALEDLGVRAALHRSGALVRGHWLRVASLTIFVTGIGLLLGPIVGTLLLLLTSASFNFVNLISGLVYSVTLPFVAIATTYLYYDLLVTEKLEKPTTERGTVLPAEI